MILRYLLIIVLLTGVVLRSSGQLSFEGTPASFSISKKSLSTIPVIDMEPVDNNKLLMEDLSDQRHLKSFRFAKSFNVDLSPSQSGLWINDGDMKVWQIGLRSRGAFSLNLLFDKMIIPQGASLFIYNPDHTKVLGAFTSNSEQSSGSFSTSPIAGDEIVVEYNEPKSAIYSGELHISSVNHDYKNIFGTRPLGESGLCNMDVYCPNASSYLTEKQSVVCILINGNTLCTGTLINNTTQDKTPYLLTAGHCIESQSDAQHSLFCFNYESPACGYGRSSINGFADQSLSGATLKARSDSLDFSLVELETSPPASYRPYFAGWDHSSTIPTSTASITHPRGDVKKISKDNNSPTIGDFDNSFKANSFWIIGKWEIGTTEGGSSGGALFNQNKLIVGTLTGGTSTCSDPTNDLFAIFYKQWDTEKGNTNQLKPWLDPNNSNATELQGLSPFDSANSCTLFTNAVLGEKDTLIQVSRNLGGYKSGHNSMRITSYAERFTKTQQTVLSSVALGVAKVSSAVSNQNSKIVVKVYDEISSTALPGNELISMDLPFSVMSEKKMNFIELPNPLTINNHYFIGFDINYSNPTDTFAVYSTPDRSMASKNFAFAKSNGSWLPFYARTDLGISTSLLINANSCENTLAVDTGTVVTGPVKFQVLYPQTGGTDYLLIRNTGTEEIGTITIYDIAGHKLYEEQRLVTINPSQISTALISSGVYFLTVETAHTRQVIKIRVIK